MSEGSNGGSGSDIRFSWSPSGEAIYVERTSGGVRNLWRMSVDPRTLQPIAVEPLTTSAGLDADLSVSPDGKSAAFTSETEHIRTWLIPINASSGQITGAGQPVTSAAVEAWDQDLSRDADKLVFCANRSGKFELRMKSLPSGPETVIAIPKHSSTKRNMVRIYSRTAVRWQQAMLLISRSAVVLANHNGLHGQVSPFNVAFTLTFCAAYLSISASSSSSVGTSLPVSTPRAAEISYSLAGFSISGSRVATSLCEATERSRLR